ERPGGEAVAAGCIHVTPRHLHLPPRPETRNAASSSRRSTHLLLLGNRGGNVPRAPSLELCVLPSGGGQLPCAVRTCAIRHWNSASYRPNVHVPQNVGLDFQDAVLVPWS